MHLGLVLIRAICDHAPRCMLACVQGNLLPQRTCTPTPQRILLKHNLDCSPDLGWATPWLSHGLELVVCDDTLDLAQTWERQGTFGGIGKGALPWSALVSAGQRPIGWPPCDC
jgi:hypothetical protein